MNPSPQQTTEARIVDVALGAIGVILLFLPDTRLASISTQSWLAALSPVLIIRILAVDRMSHYGVTSSLYLVGYSVASLVWVMFGSDSDDTLFAFNKVKDLAAEAILAIHLLNLAKHAKNPQNLLVAIVGAYVGMNMLYYIGVVLLGNDFAINFHSSIEDFERFAVGREAFLGFEPSYTGPLAAIFIFVVLAVHIDLRYKAPLILCLIFLVITSESKAAIPVMAFASGYLALRSNLRGYNKIFAMVAIALVSTMLFVDDEMADEVIQTLQYFASFGQLELSRTASQSSATRFEFAYHSLELILRNPFGYGYGNSILQLSNHLEEVSGRLMTSEIASANRFALTPKSQLLEYVLSGGVVYLLLLGREWSIYRRGVRSLMPQEQAFGMSVLIAILCAFLATERLPIITAWILFEVFCLSRQGVWLTPGPNNERTEQTVVPG